MQKSKIIFGGWYQRTTLHLTEIYDLFAFGKSDLPLDKNKLEELRRALDISEITREAGYLEFIKVKTNGGIEIRYYEDGLYILEMEMIDAKQIKQNKKKLEDYFNNKLSPATSYIFSLGAPTPKILANIKSVHPTAITIIDEGLSKIQIDKENFGNIYSKIVAKNIAVYKTPEYILIAAETKLENIATELVEMQIFFREFKDQLQKYLNIHRSLWEEISKIKEEKEVKGTEVEVVRSKLDGYQKTISLISNRINQMGTYVRTRASISKNLKIEDHLVKLFELKFEVLSDTLEYIKEIWKMTMDYLVSAIQNVVEIKNQSTSRGIQSLQLITSIGVVSTIIGYLSKNELPKLTAKGALYFALIIFVTWLVNYLVTKIYRNKKYKIKFGERSSNL